MSSSRTSGRAWSSGWGSPSRTFGPSSPEIVYVSINGFGETGPYADKRVYDPIIQAASGLASVQGGSDDARPRLVRTILPDKLTGVTAAQAVTAALLARERTGQSQHVRLSMLDAVVSFLWASDMGGQTFLEQASTEQRAASFIDLIYETKDGHMSVAVMSDREWVGLTRALERPEWLEDPRFKTPALRDEKYRRSPLAHPGGAAQPGPPTSGWSGWRPKACPARQC